MKPGDPVTGDGKDGHIGLLDQYRNTVASLLPMPCRRVVPRWSISDTDASGLRRFLDNYPAKMRVLEIGTFVGVSTFNFASHPKVLEVTSIDKNPSLADMNDWGFLVDPGPTLREVRLLDLAGAALAQFPEQQRKVRLRAGTLESVSVPPYTDDAPLVAFVDGNHAKDSVAADLKAIFEANKAAIAVLHDCRGYHGPSILAGIASFMESSQKEYYFRLFECSALEPKPPNLCVIYASTMSEEVQQAVSSLLASPKSSLIQAAFASWKTWDMLRNRADRHRKRADRQRKRADRQQKRADRQQKRADRLEAELRKARRRRWARR